ncbi:MAG: hypothetical protein WC796_05040 [Candidatus Pacearchaeota archaeon]|jgi:rRNA-processing protein FCF1
MEILLDTNFILTCVKQKIDLFSQLDELFGLYTIKIPEQVLNELKILKEKKELKITERESAELALVLLKNKKIKIINSNKKDADSAIVEHISTIKSELCVATLDKDLKIRINKLTQSNLKPKFLTIRNKKRIAIV